MFSYHKIFIITLLVYSSNCVDVERLGKPGEEIRVLDTDVCDKLPEMTTLQLLGVRIRTIEPNALHKCTKLKNIWLANNLLTVLHSGTFSHKPKLIELNVQGNKLEYLDDNVFDGLTTLEHLNLKCNRLMSFPPRYVQDLIALKYLNLASNKLINIEINGLLDKLPQLGFISYNGNDISCSRHEVIAAKVNASNIVLGDLDCESQRNPHLIESTSAKLYTSDTHYCMPDDKWELISTEFMQVSKDLKKKYEKQ